jgi:hypothetical protein
MSTNAYLPCFKCNKVLPNVMEDCDNQPYGGTEFITYGHYGSTFWDDFDGEQLVLNICDDCLRAHTERLGQRKRHLPVRCRGMTGFGHVDVDRPLVAYTGNPDDEVLNVDVDSLGEDLDDIKVHWVDDIAERREHLMR